MLIMFLGSKKGVLLHGPEAVCLFFFEEPHKGRPRFGGCKALPYVNPRAQTALKGTLTLPFEKPRPKLLFPRQGRLTEGPYSNFQSEP